MSQPPPASVPPGDPTPGAGRTRTLRHELRTPINHILGFAELLLEDLAEEDVARLAPGLRRIQRAGLHILAQVDHAFDPAVNADGVDGARLRRELPASLSDIIAACDQLRPVLIERDQAAELADLDAIRAAATRLLELVTTGLDQAAAVPAVDPASPGGEPPPRPEAPDLPDPDASARRPRGALLVVDDDPHNRALLSRRLVRLGHDVTEAGDGRQALDLLPTHSFDVLLLDIMMPEVDGFQVLAWLKADPVLRELPVIVLSALDEIDAAVTCIELGADDYLTKPVNAVLLEARLGACLEKKLLRDREVRYLRQAARVTGAAVIAHLLVAEHPLADQSPDRKPAVIGPDAERPDDRFRADLEHALEWVRLNRGDILFRQGDPGDSVYVVLSGRLQLAVEDEPDGERRVGEVRRGETAGEQEMLTGAARAATVRAIRDATLARISRDRFERLADAHPRLLTRTTDDIIGRLRATMQRPPHAQSVATIALVPIGAGVPIGEVASQVSAALGATGTTLHLSRARLPGLFGEDAEQTLLAADDDGRLAAWLNEVELDQRYVVYEAEPSASPWTIRCLRQADRILLVGHGASPPPADSILAELERVPPTVPVELVLVQDAATARPAGTRRWLDAWPVAAHHHLRLGAAADTRRLARLLTGNGFGLVLGGGGARGLAHIGVIRALKEAGIPIDIVGGTSMGALIGGLCALGQDYDEMMEQARLVASAKELLDYTLPMVSLFSSHKVTSVMQRLYGDAQIEDLWYPYFCIASSMTHSHPVVMGRGPLWRAVRASIAIAGIFSPIIAGDELLVDGGYLNNLPVDVMRGRAGSGTVIAVNVSPVNEAGRAFDLGPSISGWRVLWRKLAPWATPVQAPSAVASILRASSLNGAYQLATSQRLADLTVNPPVEAYGILDFEAYQRLAEIGYEAGRRQLAQWQAGAAPAISEAVPPERR